LSEVVIEILGLRL